MGPSLLEVEPLKEIDVSEYEVSNNFDLPGQCEICYKYQEVKVLDILTLKYNGKPFPDILNYFPLIKEYRLIEDSLNTCLHCIKQLVCSYLFLIKLEESNRNFRGLVKISAKLTESQDAAGNFSIKTDQLSNQDPNENISLVAVTSETKEFENDNNRDNIEEIRILVDVSITQKETDLKCPSCPKTFKLPVHLKRHLVKIHNLPGKGGSLSKAKLKKNKCEVCGKYFNKYVLKSHMERHSESKNHKCDICEQEFFQITSLNNHMIRHREPKFNCDYCGKMFFTKQEMLTHVRRHHTREIVCTCQFCGKGFVHKSNLLQHIRNCHPNEHEGKLLEPKVPKQCTDCGKIYSSRTSLFHHRKRAHENRQYQCSNCDLTFRNLVPLKSHLKKIHNIGQTHVCGTCKRPYFTKEELYKHQKRAHNVKTNSLYLGCSVCKMKFKIKHELIQHLQSEHLQDTEIPLLYECNICVTFFLDFDKFHGHLFESHVKSSEKIVVTEYVAGGCKIQCFTQQKDRTRLHAMRDQNE